MNGLNLNLKLEQDDPPRLSRLTRMLGPFSSVVERATRNGEVGCSIQPMGNYILLLSQADVTGHKGYLLFNTLSRLASQPHLKLQPSTLERER